MTAGRDLLPQDLARLTIELAPFGINDWAIPADRAAEVCRILAGRGGAVHSVLSGGVHCQRSDLLCPNGGLGVPPCAPRRSP